MHDLYLKLTSVLLTPSLSVLEYSVHVATLNSNKDLGQLIPRAHIVCIYAHLPWRITCSSD